MLSIIKKKRKRHQYSSYPTGWTLASLREVFKAPPDPD